MKIVEAQNIGQVVDQPIEDFKKDIEEQHVPVGMLTNIRTLLLVSYNDLVERKDLLVKVADTKNTILIFKIYRLLQAIEDKVTYLNDRIKVLIEDAKNGEVDTNKDQ